MKPYSILAFDLDGTLTKKNQTKILPDKLPRLLNYLDRLGHYSIPVTGKPVFHANRIIVDNKLKKRGVIAENSGVYQLPNSEEIKVYGESLEEINKLKKELAIESEKRGVTKIYLENKFFEVAVDSGDISILTIFTDPFFVKHKWSFKKTIDAKVLYKKLIEVITKNHWQKNLEVLRPFSDGAVQIIRKNPNNNKSIDKSLLPIILREIWTVTDDVAIAMFGDGHNDIPAMTPKEIVPITFSNSDREVREFVSNEDGYVSNYPAISGLGVVDGIYWLARNKDFFGNDSIDIRNKIKEFFPFFRLFKTISEDLKK
jgi:hydroxymethylpyrimidine pyrophosphatase-like HAD family hydrolase